MTFFEGFKYNGVRIEKDPENNYRTLLLHIYSRGGEEKTVFIASFVSPFDAEIMRLIHEKDISLPDIQAFITAREL